MNKSKFRAWFKPHLDKGIVEMFEQVEIDHELFFVSSKNKEVKYRFDIPFMDDDWLVEQETGRYDKNGAEICDIESIKKDFDVVEKALKRNEPVKLLKEKKYLHDEWYMLFGKCPVCNHYNLFTSNYCSNCGQALERIEKGESE